MVSDITWECHPSGRGRHRAYWVHIRWSQAGFRWHHQAKLHWEIWHDVVDGYFGAFTARIATVIDEIKTSQEDIERRGLGCIDMVNHCKTLTYTKAKRI